MFDIYVNSRRMFNIMSIYAIEVACFYHFACGGGVKFAFFYLMHCLKLGTKIHEERAV